MLGIRRILLLLLRPACYAHPCYLQVHCATRRAAAAARHRSERNEFLIDAKLRQGGALQIPIREYTLPTVDREQLADLDAR